MGDSNNKNNDNNIKSQSLPRLKINLNDVLIHNNNKNNKTKNNKTNNSNKNNNTDNNNSTSLAMSL